MCEAWKNNFRTFAAGVPERTAAYIEAIDEFERAGYSVLVTRRLAWRVTARTADETYRCDEALQAARHLRRCPDRHRDRRDLVARQVPECTWERE